MYAYIKGKMTQCTPTQVVVEAGGVGFLIHISLQTYDFVEKKSEIKLYVHHIQREDIQALYGFATEEEKGLFVYLLSVSGVGPNTARVVLSSMSTDEVRSAVVTSDVAAFKRVKGVGPKTAQRIIIDLKDKIGTIAPLGSNFNTTPGNTAYQEALSALVALGFPRTKASGVLAKMRKDHPEEVSVEVIIKLALNALS